MTTVFFPSRRELRLATYLQLLDNMQRLVASSVDLAGPAGVTPERLRRDMAWVGKQTKERLGRQGVGYDLPGLRRALVKLLRVDVPRKVAVVGVDGEDDVRAAIQSSSYFQLIAADGVTQADFVLLVGAGPWPEVASPPAVVLHWADVPAAATGAHVVQVDPVRLLLAVSASLARRGELYP